MPGAAPLSKPVTKKAIKHPRSPAPPMSSQGTARARGKRPRPSDASDVEKQPTVVRRKDGMASVVTAGLGERNDGSAYRKGMYLAFIDDAFAKRSKGDNERYSELLAQFRSLLPNASAARPTASTSTASEPPTPPQLRIWLDALTHVVSKLDKTHAPLVEIILALPWATLDDLFVAGYVRFIGALVSARPEWLRSVLEKCVKGLKYRSNYTTATPAAMPSLTRRMLYGRLHTLLRTLIALVPTLAPSLSPLLAQSFPSKREPGVSQICYIDNLLTLTEYCPALAEDVLTLVIERALNIDVEIQGEPEEWEDVEDEVAAEGQDAGPTGVRDVVDRPTSQDPDEDSSDDDSDDEGGIDLDDLDSDDEPNPITDEEAARNAKETGKMSNASIRKVLENRAKLDAILKVVFDHLAQVHGVDAAKLAEVALEPEPDADAGLSGSAETTPTPETPPTAEALERRLTLFRTLLDIFDRTLLRTFKTRNTQFLLFYLCSLNPDSSDHFVGVLLGRALFELDAPAVTRVAAAGYVASFVSRAKFVDIGMTRKVVRLLCQFLEGQMDDHASGVGGGQHLPVFYAVAQAVFYIFCFRWKDLLDEGDDDDIALEPGRRWMMGLETLKKAVSSSFNPLKVCAQPVVNQFATIAHKTNFLYCYAILDANRRTTSRESMTLAPTTPRGPLRTLSEPIRASPAVLSKTQPVPRQLLVAAEMDSFFPFDPFRLPLSSKFIDNIYNDWVSEEDGSSSGTSSDSDADDSSDSDDDSDTDDAEAFARGGLTVPRSKYDVEGDEDDVAHSFEAMSLSPDHSFGGRATRLSGSGNGSMPTIRI